MRSGERYLAAPLPQHGLEEVEGASVAVRELQRQRVAAHLEFESKT